MSVEPGVLAFSLVSHTNVGKTTLARTLLERDVGEVLDQAHVTETTRCHPLVETAEGERLLLWDTPGFGDSVRLLRMLRGHERPIEWLETQRYDRDGERPLHCGQLAVLNVKQHADLVLYLVNAVEHPDEAGYIAPEMELLGWLGKPTLVLLNQTGTPRPAGERGMDEELWRRALARWPIVRGVLGMDAFTRCWVQEGVLLERARTVLPEEDGPLCARIVEAWRGRRMETFSRSMELLGAALLATAEDREAIVEGAWGNDRKQAMAALARRLEERTTDALERLIALHGLEGRSGADLTTALTDFEAPASRLSPRVAGVWGGVVSGLTFGVGADVLSGGLSLGSGMIVGALAGGLGAAGLARAYTVVRGGREPRVRWSDRMLERTVEEFLLRYLAVAHFGRGRGAFREREHPAFWRKAVVESLGPRRAEASAVWKRAAALEGEPAPAELGGRLEVLLGEVGREVLARFYPEAPALR